jgi:mono/diheme cytochrome c family protein
MAGSRRRIPIVLAIVALGAPWLLPAATGQERAVNGGDLFQSYCVVCHGTDAKGTGPLASSLTRRPADLTALASTNGGTFPAEMVARIIDGRNPVKGHGGGDMPVWGEALLKTQGAGTEAAVKERIDALVAHLRGLQK